MIAPAGSSLAPYQPAQRYCVVDERHRGRTICRSRNVMTAVVRVEQSRSPADLQRVLEALASWLRGPDDSELRRAFVDIVRCETGADLLARVAALAADPDPTCGGK